MDRFSQILFDLGKIIQTTLHIDQHGVCQLDYKTLLSVQLQYLEQTEELLLAAFLCEVPPGTFREKLFGACLAFNAKYPRVGTLSYCEQNNQLTFFTNTPARRLTGEAILEMLDRFVETGLQWKKAVETGSPLPDTSNSPSKDGGLFGLRP